MRNYLFLIFMSISCLAQGDAEAEKPWSNELDLSIVGTGGNSESLTMGLKNDFTYQWETSKLGVKLGGVRVESTQISHYAVGTEDQYQVIEEKETVTTDEKFFLNTKFQKEISETFFWDVLLDWDRNEFAGIKNRYALGLGVGHIWVNTDQRAFSTSYTLLYNNEELVLETPGFDDRYGSLKLSYEWKETKGNLNFKQDFAVMANLETSEDFRADLKNEFSTGLTKRMALKIGLDLAFDNQPAFKGIPLLFDTVEVATVPYELENLDYLFKTSLVLTF